MVGDYWFKKKGYAQDIGVGYDGHGSVWCLDLYGQIFNVNL